MTYVKRLAHRLGRWFQRRSALLYELKALDATVLQASWDVAEARRERDEAITERDFWRLLSQEWVREEKA